MNPQRIVLAHNTAAFPLKIKSLQELSQSCEIGDIVIRQQKNVTNIDVVDTWLDSNLKYSQIYIRRDESD